MGKVWYFVSIECDTDQNLGARIKKKPKIFEESAYKPLNIFWKR